MGKERKRGYVPRQQNAGDWFIIIPQDYSDIIDVYLKVKHSHADQPYSGQESEEEVHMMLSLDELLQMEDAIHREIIRRLKR